MLMRLLSIFSPPAFLCVFLAVPLASCSGQEPYPDVIPIGQVQGKVPAGARPDRYRSPLNGEAVTVEGLIYQILSWKNADGSTHHGFFIQNPAEDSDGDDDTSDGLFVYTGALRQLPREGQPPYEVRRGDRIVIRGRVNERFGQTELSNARVLGIKPGGDLDKLLPPVPLKLPRSWQARQRMLESLEGMRVVLPAGAVSVVGTHPKPQMGDMEVWVVGPDHPVLTQEGQVARLFRKAHPLSVVPEEIAADDIHGDRLLLGSLGLRARSENLSDQIPDLHAGSRFSGALTGAVHYAYREYRLQIESLPEVEAAKPGGPELPKPGASDVRIASYNVENLYDFVNDPFDRCDFHGDPGCRGTRFPLNYVPSSDEVYRARLSRMAQQIVLEMNSPEILLIQEAEDQDIAKMVDGRLVYGQENDADGQTDSLQELALEIQKIGGPEYTVAVDRDGTDERGIICAWMYQAERFELRDPASSAKLMGSEPDLPEGWEWLPLVKEASNPKAFNARYKGAPDSDPGQIGVFSRALQILALKDVRTGDELWLLNNHFNSGPNRKVERRTQQARINAVLAAQLMRQFPDALVIVGGDLNVFPRPDDPLDPPSDQLGPLYEAGLENVYDRIVSEKPGNAYSYIFRGVPNVLDHFFVSPSVSRRIGFAAYLKLNASAPEAHPDSAPLRASDHDPLLLMLRAPEPEPDPAPVGEDQ